MSHPLVTFGIIAIMVSVVLDLLGHIVMIGKERPVIKGEIVAIEAVVTIVALWILMMALGLIR